MARKGKRATRRKKGDGSHYFDKKNNRHIWTIEINGESHHVTNRNEETARLQFEELKRQLRRGVDIERSRVTVKTWIEEWIESEAPERKTTRDDYRKRGDLYIYPTLGEIRICDLKRTMVVAWVNGMMNIPKDDGRYWARSSITQALGLLKRSFDTAVPDLLEYNPAASVKVPLKRKGDEYQIDQESNKKKVFTADEMQLVLDELWRTNENHKMYAYFALLSETGLRRGEGLGLRKKDIDFDNRTITIAQQVVRNPMTNEIAITTPKTESSKRALPISDSATQLLREQCIRVGAMRPNDLIFPNKHSTARQPNDVTQLFRRTCERLGFVGYNLHSVRHYRVTIWRTEGVDLEVASALAGHKGVKVTAEVYSEATMDRKRAAIEKVRKAE